MGPHHRVDDLSEDDPEWFNVEIDGAWGSFSRWSQGSAGDGGVESEPRGLGRTHRLPESSCGFAPVRLVKVQN
jgi:hypothetical protein